VPVTSPPATKRPPATMCFFAPHPCILSSGLLGGEWWICKSKPHMFFQPVSQLGSPAFFLILSRADFHGTLHLAFSHRRFPSLRPKSFLFPRSLVPLRPHSLIEKKPLLFAVYFLFRFCNFGLSFSPLLNVCPYPCGQRSRSPSLSSAYPLMFFSLSGLLRVPILLAFCPPHTATGNSGAHRPPNTIRSCLLTLLPDLRVVRSFPRFPHQSVHLGTPAPSTVVFSFLQNRQNSFPPAFPPCASFLSQLLFLGFSGFFFLLSIGRLP